MKRAHAKVFARINHCAKAQRGTLTLDRHSGLVTVRAYRARHSYTLPIDLVAQMIVERAVLATRNPPRRRHRPRRRKQPRLPRL